MKIKQTIKCIPVFGPLALFVYRIFVPAPTPYTFERSAWETDPQSTEECGLTKIKNLLNYTKTSGSSYSAKQFSAGYHTLRVHDKELKGQRDPLDRLKKLQINFSGLRVLDIGCNQGGILFAVASDIKWGVGVDVDSRLINCCTKLSQLTQNRDKLSFYTFNIDKDPHQLLLDFLPEQTAKVDVIFLLAVCMWVDKWRELIDLCAKITECLVFESNGLPDAQAAQIKHLRQRFGKIDIVDYDKQGNRQLIVATH